MACKGIIFCLELGLISLKEKTAIRHRIEAAGGAISATLGSSTHVLITSASEKERGGYKVSSALNLGIPVFIVDDLDQVLSNPPSPRKATSVLQSTLTSRAASTSSAAPLINWGDLSSSPSDPSPPSPASSSTPYEASAPAPSSSSALDASSDDWLLGMADVDLSSPPVSFTAPSDPFGDDSDEEEEPLFDLFGDIEVSAPKTTRPATAVRAPKSSVSKASPVATSSAPASVVAKASTTTAADDDEDAYFMSAFNGMGDLFDAPSAPRSSGAPSVPNPPAPASTLTPKEQLDAKLAMLAKKLPAETMSTLRASLEPKSLSSVSSTSALSSSKSKTLSSGLSPARSPSASHKERVAKYEAILANRPAPLIIAPSFAAAPITFTPLTFELKPTSSATSSKIRTPLRASSSSARKGKLPSPTPIVFSSLLDHDDSSSSSSSPDSPKSLFSAEDEEETAKSEGTIPEQEEHKSIFASTENITLGADESDEYFSEEDDDDDDDDYFYNEDDFGEEDVSPLTQKATPAKPAKKIPSGPRVYRDRSTGLAWTKKVEKPQIKLVLDSGDGKAKVMKLDDDPVLPLLSSSSASVGAEPRLGVPKPKKIYTGHINPKVSWVDIVLGKASTTKRVPAMDGLKLFVGGVSFDDLRQKGKTAAEQLTAYKLEYLKKMKAKNEKALKKLKKKARREALEKAVTDEEGRVTVPKAAPVKMKDSGLARMKTDEELVKEIVQWGPKQVAMAIEQRQTMVHSIFKRFGEVTQFNVDTTSGFIHVTYKNTASAKAAMRSLGDFDTRVAVVRGLRETFTRAAKETFPAPSFYVRWTACYQRKLNAKKKDTKDAKQTKHDAAVSSKAAAAVATANKVAVPSPIKPLLPQEWTLPPVESKLEAPFPESN